MKTIETLNGIIKYEEVRFVNGVKKIDREKSKENLLLFKEVMDKHSVNFGLIYGTLLGAIRENNFIAHDEDTDVFILKEEEVKFLGTLPDLEKKGFKVGRYTEKLLSVIRNGEYIDTYFFRKKGRNKRESEGYEIKSYHLENLEPYRLFGVDFMVPVDVEKLLVSLYGKDWRIPKENAPATNYGSYLKIRNFIMEHNKPLFNLLSKAKKKLIPSH